MTTIRRLCSSFASFMAAFELMRECNSLANAGRYQEARDLLKTGF